VDGQVYGSAAVFTWPAGSKHTLLIEPWQYAPGQLKTRYDFLHWSTAAGPIPDPSGNVTITADPATTSYNADLSIEYAVSLNFFQCGDGPCASPGTIWVSQAAYTHDADVWMSAGSTASLMATPNSGYVFTGWAQTGGLGSPLYGFVVNSPVSVYPRFAVARTVRFQTVPDGLQLLADRAPVLAGTVFEWGWNTTHTVAAVSPQIDREGHSWVFQSWSDGGTFSHDTTVAPGPAPLILTAQFVPAVAVAVFTDPPGLAVTIDGVDGASPRYVSWSAGETHTIAASSNPVDSSGAPWSFRQWSNGGSRTQTLVVTDADTGPGIRVTAGYDPLSRIRLDTLPSGLPLAVDGAACQAPCDFIRPVGATVRITAPPSINSSDGVRLDVGSWQGVPGPVFTTVAGFRKGAIQYSTSYRLALSTAPAAAGNWRISPASTDGFYPAGATLTVGIDAAAGMKFRSWGSDLTGVANPQPLVMDAAHAVTALFDKLPDTPPPPHISNAAGDTPSNGVAAGSIASLYGSSLVSVALVASSNPLPQSLGGVSLVCAGNLVPLVYVSPQQINFQVPWELAPGDYQVQLHRADGSVIVVPMTVVRDAPGLFFAAHADGSVVSSDFPAAAGETLLLYGTGFGPTAPCSLDGFQTPAAVATLIMDHASVVTGERVIDPDAAFSQPGTVGVALVRFQLTDDLVAASGGSISIRVGGISSNSIQLPVR